MMETLAACPICSSSDLTHGMEVPDHFLSKELFSLVDCLMCGFRFTNPRPTETEVTKYYHSSAYISHTNSSTGVRDRLYQFARNWAIRSKYRLINKYASGGQVLDIGSGTGDFLAHLASRGYTVQGVEPALHAREIAIAEHGLSILPSFSLVPTQEQFRVVTMWHVLEHMHDLRRTLKRIHACMTNGGILVIAVPDRESWDARAYGTWWAAWDTPRHLHHFRRQDIHRLLHEHGFEIMETRRMWLDALYVSILSEQYRSSSKIGSLLKGVTWGLYSNFRSLIGIGPTSSTMYLARKTPQ